MTITRLFQSGFELNTINEVDGYPNSDFGASNEMTISTTKFKRGARSLRATSAANRPRGKAFSATQIRAGFFVNHAGLNGGSAQAAIAIIPCSLATASVLYWHSSSNELRLRVNNATVDTIDVGTAGFATVDTWYHLGVTYKADGSTGFFSVYLDGVQILTYTGNTGTSISGLYLGGRVSTLDWASNVYFDDLTIDDAASESDAAVPSVEYLWIVADGAGASTNLTPNTGANYAAVDDTTPDDDSTYVYGTADGVKDSYTMSNITLPSGYGIAARIATAWARKTNAGVDSQFKLGSRSNGGTELLGSGIALATSYGMITQRQTTDPDSAAWTETTINNSQGVIETEGSF